MMKVFYECYSTFKKFTSDLNFSFVKQLFVVVFLTHHIFIILHNDL